MSAPTSNHISGCTEFSTHFWGPKTSCLSPPPPLVMPNTLLEFSMIFLLQVSPIWHLVFTSSCFPLHHSHLPLYLKCSHFISQLSYTFTHLLPSFLHPPLSPDCYPTPTYPHFHFFCLFYSYPLATITTSHYLISN